MATSKPISALELCEAVRNGEAIDLRALNRILRVDERQGLVEVQAATPWHAIAAALRPGDARAQVRTTMPTVGQSLARNAAGPDGRPAVAHVASLALVTPEGELRRVSRERETELFALAIGGQDLFGTLYSVTLRIESLARAVERARNPQELTVKAHPTALERPLELLLSAKALEPFMKEAETRCSDWRMPLCSVVVRETAAESDTFLRWARRDYLEVRLGFARTAALGSCVRSRQLRGELIGAAIGAGGSFQIATTVEATREQTRACYPEMADFLAHKRRFDPNERLANAWYLHQRSVMTSEPCAVRWAS
ncbi:MAG: FAD-binding oxidoreductase [Betaproteobacteria bacterium]|nr:FAD-binding oxidoreductase [Betaproteobacteria bacterium]